MKNGYKTINRSRLSSRKHRIASTEETLSQVPPLTFDSNVYTGEKKVLLDKQGIHYVSNR